MLNKKYFPLLIFIAVFPVYLFLNADNIKSDSYDDYPFGADVPRYTAIFKYDKINSGKIATRHSVPVYINIFYKNLFPSFEDKIGKNLFMKFPYAFFGALTVTVAFYLSKLILETPSHRLAFTLIYAFSGAILYFSSVPESYIITTFFTALYIYTFLKYKDSLSWKSISLLILWYVLSVLSEVLTVSLIIIPAIYFAKDIFKNNKKRLSLLFFFTLSVFLAYILLNYVMRTISGDTLIAYYISFKEGNESIPLLSVFKEIGEVGLNFFFFSIGYPSYAVTHPLSWDPSYIGFFKPTLWEYFKIKTATVFILFYSLFFISFIKQAKRKTLLTLSFMGYILIRLIGILFFNPWESYLYVTPAVLPLLVILMENINDYPKKTAGYFLYLFLLVLMVNNLLFFLI
ncbi:MAG: hypothetical protein ISR59_05600 [Anaerolineales bacterium]|nr:hypothetical protein [Anaerolineales bacterium]